MPEIEEVSLAVGPGKAYLLVRADLSAGAQVVQAAHAMSLFPSLDAEAFATWLQTSNFLIALAVRDEQHLLAVLDQARSAGSSFALWCEPDYANEATAALLVPSPANASVLGSLPLAGSQPPPKKAIWRERALKAKCSQDAPAETSYWRGGESS